MMRRRSFHRTVARALAAAYLLVAAGPAVALVFCVGADGHQSIESALAEDCCAKLPQAPAAAAMSRSERPCDCTDTPLVFKARLQSEAHADGSLPPAPAIALPTPVSTLSSLASGALAERALVDRSSALVVLRSVVLLV